MGAVRNVKLADIEPKTYVGAASVPDASGKQIAREVLVFPEACAAAAMVTTHGTCCPAR